MERLSKIWFFRPIRGSIWNGGKSSKTSAEEGEFIANDVLLNKALNIERCLVRIEQEYRGHEAELKTNFTRQDSIVLNLQRACEGSIDAAMHLVRIKRLGLPQESREAFALIHDAGIIDE